MRRQKMDLKDQPLDVCEEGSEDESDLELEEETTPAKFDFLSGDPISGVRKVVQNFGKEVADRSHEMKESLKPFLGKVFHAVGNSGAMYRYRVGFDGRLTLEKRLKGSFISVEKLNETKGRLLEAGKAVPIKARRKWRATITGDPEKRIRDHMKETPQVKMMDKVSFTLGVVIICFSEWLLLRFPTFFPYFYYCLMPVLFTCRYFEYSAIKSELYMLDFCYFVNFSVAVQTFFYPNNLAWFQANYVLSLGPICFAIVIWRNSLVFHSLDKITSFFLHSFPSMICHIYRWKIVNNEMEFADEYIGLMSHFVLPLTIYMTWQIAYLFITEKMLYDRLAADPEIVTSLRYLSRDEKNSMNQLATIACHKLGLLKKGQPFDPETKLAKLVFVVAQLCYTLATMIPTAFLFMTYQWSCIYIVLIFITGVWNGASYYIEVFSKRYNLKFEEKTSSNTNLVRQEGEEASDDYSSTNEDEHEADFEFDDSEFVEALNSADLDIAENEEQLIFISPKASETLEQVRPSESSEGRETSEEPVTTNGPTIPTSQ